MKTTHDRMLRHDPTAADDCTSCGADAERVARGRELLLADEVYVDIAETFRALADGTRAKIVYSLLRQVLCTCDLAAIVGMSESVVSQHLRVLRQLRLVRSRRSGKMVFHTLDDGHIRILLSVALSHVRDVERATQGLEGFLSLLPAVERAPAPLSVEEAVHGA